MKTFTELRLYLARGGYTPIPLYGKSPPIFGKNNQRKGMSGWEKTEDVTPDQVKMWERIWPDAVNTGALTRRMPTLDIDILNEEAARACEDFVRGRCEGEGHILVRIGLPPKRAILFHTNDPFDKIVINLIAPNAGADTKPEKIEFLGSGQQVAVAGIHPDTKKPYRWYGGELSNVKLKELPYIDKTEAQRLVDGIVDLLIRDFGYQRAAERPRTRGNGSTNGYHTGGGSADWQWLLDNIREGRELHDSIRDLAAKLIASGMSAGAAINLLRALVDGSSAPHDERWQERYDDIPRAVETAVAKGFVATEVPPRAAEELDEVWRAAGIALRCWRPTEAWEVFSHWARVHCIDIEIARAAFVAVLEKEMRHAD
jgi:hypothetical protein